MLLLKPLFCCYQKRISWYSCLIHIWQMPPVLNYKFCRWASARASFDLDSRGSREQEKSRKYSVFSSSIQTAPASPHQPHWLVDHLHWPNNSETSLCMFSRQGAQGKTGQRFTSLPTHSKDTVVLTGSFNPYDLNYLCHVFALLVLFVQFPNCSAQPVVSEQHCARDNPFYLHTAKPLLWCVYFSTLICQL